MLSASRPDLSRRWKEKLKSFRKIFAEWNRRQKLTLAPRKRQQHEFGGRLPHVMDQPIHQHARAN